MRRLANAILLTSMLAAYWALNQLPSQRITDRFQSSPNRTHLVLQMGLIQTHHL